MNERSLSVQGLQVRYKIAGEGPVLLILHGWGSSSEKWESVQIGIAQKGYRVIVPDLPGFGQSEYPSEAWGAKEYSEFVVQFAEELGFSQFFLAGHSFGGQIAIQFAADNPERVEKLVLLAAAGLRKNLGMKENILRFLAKPVNVLLSPIPSLAVRDKARRMLYRMIGKQDYARAKGIMKEVMAKVIRQDLSSLFPRIKASTLIIWGEKDSVTPLQDAYIMEREIPEATLQVMPGVDHDLNSEVPEQVAKFVSAFLK